MEEVLDRKEQSNEKAVDKTFNKINQQNELEASQDEDLEIKSQSNFQSLQEKLDKSIDPIYGFKSNGGSQYLIKKYGRIDEGKTNKSVDSYADMVLLSIVSYIQNNVEYSGYIDVNPDNTIVIASTCLGIPIKKDTVDEQHLCFSKV